MPAEYSTSFSASPSAPKAPADAAKTSVVVWKTRTRKAQEPWKEALDGHENSCRLAMRADGTMVPLVAGAWAEVRTLTTGEVPAGSADAEKVHVGHLSSCSRRTDATPVPALADVDRRRRLVQTKEVCAVMDGAE